MRSTRWNFSYASLYLNCSKHDKASVVESPLHFGIRRKEASELNQPINHETFPDLIKVDEYRKPRRRSEVPRYTDNDGC